MRTDRLGLWLRTPGVVLSGVTPSQNSIAIMFGSLKQKLQSFSPVGSPVASPSSSPRPARRRFGLRTPARMKQRREEFREVQSDPECDYGTARKQRRKKSEPTRVPAAAAARARDASAEGLYDVPPQPRGPPPRQQRMQSQTLGRLTGRKQVGAGGRRSASVDRRSAARDRLFGAPVAGFP